MREGDNYRQRVGRLVAQDPEINDQQMEELRMQLEQSLDACEKKVRWVRKRILIGLAVYIGTMVILQFLRSLWSDAAPSANAALVRGLVYFPFLIAFLIAGVLGLCLVLRYVFVYMPQLTRARFELQTALLQELVEQTRQLHKTVQQREKG